ncbi:hypothetical protein [Clostridium sp.]|uniref:hypothetical protein n=1 Tax=Clostridium sp. TaxID=1506 RepID=UPI0026323B9D|nr:hypothetical protein [Clostridium sp.]
MKKLATNLTKKEIALSATYNKWYKIVEDEIRLFVDETAVDENNKLINKIYWKEDRGELGFEGPDSVEEFYEKHKDLKVRLFVKAEEKKIYNEYRVTKWNAGEKDIEIIFA